MAECQHPRERRVYCGYYLATLQRRWAFVCEDCLAHAYDSGPDKPHRGPFVEWIPAKFDADRFDALMLQADPGYVSFRAELKAARDARKKK